MEKPKKLIIIISAVILVLGSLPYIGVGALVLLALIIGIVIIIRIRKKKKARQQATRFIREAVDDTPFEKHYKQVKTVQNKPSNPYKQVQPPQNKPVNTAPPAQPTATKPAPPKSQPTNGISVQRTVKPSPPPLRRTHCPNCGAITIPKDGYCEYCDSKII